MHLPIFATLATSASILMSACGTSSTAGQASDSPPVSTRCNAAPAQFAMGRNADASLENEARTRASAKTVRILRPNQVVTMEFNAERLTLTVDDTGRVKRVSCG